jgi:glycosyltransferase involved in cell wall biosynthesis
MSAAPEADLVSVLIAAYNTERTIDETLRSVQSQSYAHLQILVIDDGSTDATAARVAALARDDPRIRLIRKPNGGLSSARNAGLAQARGAFVAVVDADDLMHPDKLALEVAALKSCGPDVGMAYSWTWRIDQHGHLLPDGLIGYTYEGETFAALLLQVFLISPTFRAGAIRAIGGYNEDCKRAEDLEAYLRLTEKFDIVCVPRVLLGYRQLPHSLSRNVAGMRASVRTIIDDASRRHPELPSRIFRISNANFHLYHAKRSRADRNWREMVRCLAYAARQAPLFSVAVTCQMLLRRLASAHEAGIVGRPFLPPPPALDALQLPDRSWIRKWLDGYVTALAIDRDASRERSYDSVSTASSMP